MDGYREAINLGHKVIASLRKSELVTEHVDLQELLQFDGIVLDVGGGSLKIAQDRFDKIASALSRLFPMVSQTTLHSAIQHLLIDSYNQVRSSGCDIGSDEARALVEQPCANAIATLAAKIGRFGVAVPVFGLDLDCGDLDFGSIQVRNANRTGILDDFRTNRFLDDETIAAMVDEFESIGSYMWLELEGDERYCREVAHQQCQLIADVLTLYVSSCKRSERVYQPIDVSGNFRSFFRLDAMTRIDGDSEDKLSRLYFPSLHSARPGKKKLDQQFLNLLRWHMMFELGRELVASPGGDREPLVNRLRSSVQWYARAVRLTDEGEKYVALAIALDTLLGSRRKTESKEASWGAIGQILADRCAYLLCSTYDERIKMLERVRHLYGVRSAIVHRGESVAYIDLVSLDDLVSKAIVAFAKRGFRSEEHFEEYILDQMYSPKPKAESSNLRQ